MPDQPLEDSQTSSTVKRAGSPRRSVGVLMGVLLVIGVVSLVWLARTPRGPSPKVVLFGIDGGDWRVIEPLMKAGRMPNLARLVADGASGNLTSYQPTMSPQIWNTIVTGKHYQEHGVDWFAVKLSDPGSRAELEDQELFVPITSASRKVPAVWDILGQAGDTVGVIGYWATWPATPVNGFMVSDRFSYSRINKVAGADQMLEHQTHPPELAAKLRGDVMSPEQVTAEDRAGFIKGSVEVHDWRISHDIVAEFDITYAQAQTYRRVGLHLLEQGQPDFFAIYFQGVDVTCHYFWEFRRPAYAGREVPAESIEKFGGVIDAFYQYQDKILGEFLERLNDDTVVIVCSDHGFKDLVFDERTQPHISGWHRLNGMLVIAGPGIKAGTKLTGVDVYDITPTILALRNLPVAKDMKGRVIAEAFEQGALGKVR
ncbi:MAG: alkaline phosphatase family protein, partial [Phycisphaerae bacterium]